MTDLLTEWVTDKKKTRENKKKTKENKKKTRENKKKREKVYLSIWWERTAPRGLFELVTDLLTEWVTDKNKKRKNKKKKKRVPFHLMRKNSSPGSFELVTDLLTEWVTDKNKKRKNKKKKEKGYLSIWWERRAPRGRLWLRWCARRWGRVRSHATCSPLPSFSSSPEPAGIQYLCRVISYAKYYGGKGGGKKMIVGEKNKRGKE